MKGLIMKRVDVVEFYKALNTIPKGEYNRFLLYSIEKTKENLLPIVKQISDKEESIKKDIFEFEKKRYNILGVYSVKDESGNPIVENSQVVIQEEFKTIVQESIASLRKEYSAAFEKFKEDDKLFGEYLEEDVDVSFVKVSFKNLPKTLNTDTFNVLLKLVKETDEEIQLLEE